MVHPQRRASGRRRPTARPSPCDSTNGVLVVQQLTDESIVGIPYARLARTVDDGIGVDEFAFIDPRAAAERTTRKIS